MSNIQIEEIENGSIVTYRNEGTYETKKRHFPTAIEARTFVIESMQKEITHIESLQIEAKLPAGGPDESWL